MTAREESNAALLKWFSSELTNVIKSHAASKFDINIDPQQLGFLSTWNFFKKLTAFNKNIAVELTEAIPLESNSIKMQNSLPTLYLNRLKKMGFTTVIDDIDSGQNTLKLITDNLHNIDRIKISLLAFKNLDSQVLLSFLKAWHVLADHYGLELVIEGTNNLEIVKSLVANDFLIQQGFYWQKPQIITLNNS
ncbi:C-di-GMP-specific phosphodiesterase [Liquorilactobacillus oeni DSM 19972]|uniref:C-di-GMP-specific phosphodiesterase n=1 Tax=Liquorilactobacillus oeni DSM 19972 TaxID=1423777 RepID=A0A0R1M8U9_9LACO|nr:C-di-GMP-specific phosphodiesterase [Liquorilactobacillus oeni DSM 19972]